MAPLIFHYHYLFHRDQFEISCGYQPDNALFIIEKGSFECTFVGQETQIVRAGDFLFVPRQHAFCRSIIEPIDFHLIYFLLNEEDPLSNQLTAGVVVSSDKERLASNLELFREILSARRTDEFSAHIAEHLLNDVFYMHLYASTINKAQQVGQKERVFVQQAIKYFETHYSEPISLKTVADAVNISPTTLSRGFKEEINLSPIEYLIQLRIRRARHFLLMTNDSITSIAEKCGYENIAYFSNAFKKICGCSPSEYRRKIPQI